jgi:hypothetical protein
MVVAKVLGSIHHLNISFSQALVGDNLIVPNLVGKVSSISMDEQRDGFH